MKLTDREWKEFKITDVFTFIKRGKRLIANDRKYGDLCYYSASNTNNGLTDFISNPLFIINVPAIVYSTFGDAYFSFPPFTTSDEMTILSTPKLNKYNALFIAQALKQNKSKYSFGRKAFSNKILKDKILLPITKTEKPDYQFMEDYIKDIMQRKRQEYIDYANVKLEQNKTKHIIPLQSKKWKEFFVVDIFPSIQRGKRLIKEKQVSGCVPYVSSTAMNNGVDNFIQYDSSKMRKYQNCLSVANSGSVGASFYEPFEYVASDHVTHLKNVNFNKNIYLFISAMTNRWSQKYNFNREINDPRISREKILFPVNNNDEPDYAYMEQYVNNLLIQKYNDYLEYAKQTV